MRALHSNELLNHSMRDSKLTISLCVYHWSRTRVWWEAHGMRKRHPPTPTRPTHIQHTSTFQFHLWACAHSRLCRCRQRDFNPLQQKEKATARTQVRASHPHAIRARHTAADPLVVCLCLAPHRPSRDRTVPPLWMHMHLGCVGPPPPPPTYMDIRTHTFH